MQMQARPAAFTATDAGARQLPAARELTAVASGSTSEPARPTPRHVGCIHCHQRRPRMSSLQLQVGRRQDQRDRDRSCSQPRRPTQRHIRRSTHRRVVRRCLPCTRDLRTYCQCRCKPAAFTTIDAGARQPPAACRCKPAAFTTTDAGARQPPAAHELTAAASGSTSEPARPTQRRIGCIHCHRRRCEAAARRT